MKILLINTNTTKPLVAPIGPEYLGEYLQDNGIKVSTLDLAFQKDIKETINKTKPDLIGITVRNTDDCSFPAGVSFLPKIKRLVNYIKKMTDSPIILGGVGFSVMPESILEYLNVDFGIYGDGEEAFLKFINKYPNIKDLPNLIYKEGGGYKKNRKEFFNLKRLNPRRELFDNRRYFHEGGMGSIETKRGCIKDCIYCADVVAKGKKPRLREPENVADEIQRMYSLGINYFHLCDSEFNIPYHHAASICEEIIESGINKKIFWYCYCSPKEFDFDLAKLMKSAGCVGINFGVDSGSDKMLENLKRDFRVEDLFKVSEICHKLDMTFMFDLLLGGPGEDEKTVRETIENMKRLKPDVVGTAIGIRIYQGTSISDMVKAEGVSESNKNLHGAIKNNDDFIRPIFYISSKIGKRITTLVEELASNDKRFLFPYGKNKRNYNYSQNLLLVNAIKNGFRGAFWDILRKIQ